ncbi:MAG: hypothetical protein NVSMB17_18840 [Candidatus Dormibacteria bacterium]
MQALGLAMVIVGGMVILAGTALRPVGGALAICGAGLLVYGWMNGRRRPPAPPPRPSQRWDEEHLSTPRGLYQPTPGEVRFRDRTTEAAPVFTKPNPGAIPAPREPAPTPGGPAYTTGRADVPAPRERPRGAAEYTVPAPDPALDRGVLPPPLTASPRPVELPVDEDPYLPPMAPPPAPG